MITYSRIGAKVWRQVSHFGPVLARELGQEEIERLDQEILRWYESVPEEIRVRNWDKDAQITSTPSYNLQRLRIWTYLRFNQVSLGMWAEHLELRLMIFFFLRYALGYIHLSYIAPPASWRIHCKHSVLSI